MLKMHRVEVNEYGKRRHLYLGHTALFWYALALWLVTFSIGWKVAGWWPGHGEKVGAQLNPGTTKNKKGRMVKLTNETHQLLAASVAGKQPDDYLFTRANGEPVLDFRGAWEGLCKRAGVPELLFHDLRRSAVRNMVRRGVTEKEAMTISGHLTRSVVDRYDIVDERDLERAASAIEVGRVRETSHDLTSQYEARGHNSGTMGPV